MCVLCWNTAFLLIKCVLFGSPHCRLLVCVCVCSVSCRRLWSRTWRGWARRLWRSGSTWGRLQRPLTCTTNSSSQVRNCTRARTQSSNILLLQESFNLWFLNQTPPGTTVSMETTRDLLDLICLYCDKDPVQSGAPQTEDAVSHPGAKPEED